MSENGILLIDKPIGWTSFDVVAKIRSNLRRQTGLKRPKVGHSGTLDPLATGLLVILVGSYCKKADEFSGLDKVYEVELTIGTVSSTDDREGALTTVSDRRPSQNEIRAVLHRFVGNIEQIPPIFSAIKVNGTRAYKLARTGQTPELKARTVSIRSISDIEYQYPKVTFVTEVSSGTYIRALARDIGEALGTGAHMSALRRVRIGPFILADAHQISSQSTGLPHLQRI